MRYGRWGVSFDADETAETGRIARRLGGYDEMLRLERDLAGYQRRGIEVRMVLDDRGRRQLQPVGEGDMPAAPTAQVRPESAPGTRQVRTRGLRGFLRRILPR